MLIALFAVSSLTRAEPIQLPLSVLMSVDLCPGDIGLLFSLTNRSSEPITIDESALPWVGRYSITILAVPKKSDPLSGIFPVEDFFAEKAITLQPSETRNGRVPLNWHVKDLQKVLQVRDVLVFWHYEPKNIARASLGEYGGWITLKALRSNQ